jgi:hypothetical protein
MIRWSTTLVIVVFAWSLCGCDSASTPTSPTAHAAPVPVATFTLIGNVSRAQGDTWLPVEGVRIELGPGCDGRCPQFALTDSAGAYRLSGVPAGTAEIAATRWGYNRVRAAVPIAADTVFDLAVVRDVTYTLSGIVRELTDNGAFPLEGVTVYCDACGELGHTFLSTGADGSYSFPEVFAGNIDILVSKDGYRGVNPIRTLSTGAAQYMAPVTADSRLDVELTRK